MKYLYRYLLLFLIFLSYGCLIGDEYSVPVKLKYPANSFKPHLMCLGEKVLTVEVHKHTEPDINELAWQIKAVRDVPARGFVVTAGKIHKDFQQIFPPTPDKFYLTRGEEYAITIHTNCTGVHAGGTFWLAE